MSALSRIGPDRLDVYSLRLLAGPLGFSLLTLLLAELLERLLRLFDLAAQSGAPVSAVFVMAANLVPHYLGLAIPTAFMAAIFMAVARLGDNSELDVMLATGRSIGRIAMPYFAVSILLCAFNLYLFGYLQPISRYAYHVAVNDTVQAGWDARVEDNRFVSAGHGFTLSADKVGSDGRTLAGVFVERRQADTEEITTSHTGRLVPAPGDHRLLLELDDGLTVTEEADQTVSRVKFEHGKVNEDFTPSPPPYRPRGDSVSELTFPELWQGLHGGAKKKTRTAKPHAPDAAGSPDQVQDPNPPFKHSKLAGELHGRLARTFLMPLLVLLAMPLGMASKRGNRAPGVVFACLALLALNQTLQFGESLAESGRAAAIPAVWTPFLVFAVICIWLFRSSLIWPGDNPVIRAMSAIDGLFEGYSLKRKPKVAK